MISLLLAEVMKPAAEQLVAENASELSHDTVVDPTLILTNELAFAVGLKPNTTAMIPMAARNFFTWPPWLTDRIPKVKTWCSRPDGPVNYRFAGETI
jgi:hypothetical protein